MSADRDEFNRRFMRPVNSPDATQPDSSFPDSQSMTLEIGPTSFFADILISASKMWKFLPARYELHYQDNDGSWQIFNNLTIALHQEKALLVPWHEDPGSRSEDRYFHYLEIRGYSTETGDEIRLYFSTGGQNFFDRSADFFSVPFDKQGLKKMMSSPVYQKIFPAMATMGNAYWTNEISYDGYIVGNWTDVHISIEELFDTPLTMTGRFFLKAFTKEESDTLKSDPVQPFQNYQFLVNSLREDYPDIPSSKIKKMAYKSAHGDQPTIVDSIRRPVTEVEEAKDEVDKPDLKRQRLAAAQLLNYHKGDIEAAARVLAKYP